MEKSKLNTLSSILSRYKLAHRRINNDDVEIGGGHNLKYLKLYYFYLPIIIGSVIVLIGFISDFILFKFCGVPFLLYAVYGLAQINNAIKENRNTTIISNGEVSISKNDRKSILNLRDIKNYEIKTERLDNGMHISELLISDNENNEHMFLTLIDDELPILAENMKFIKDFIQVKMNATNTRMEQEPGSRLRKTNN
jgi:hypothetical protein